MSTSVLMKLETNNIYEDYKTTVSNEQMLKHKHNLINL
jgi:hypothetical protein